MPRELEASQSPLRTSQPGQLSGSQLSGSRHESESEPETETETHKQNMKMYINGAKLTNLQHCPNGATTKQACSPNKFKLTRSIWHLSVTRSNFVWLPIIFIFLLPSFQLPTNNRDASRNTQHKTINDYQSSYIANLDEYILSSSISQFLVPLLRLPLDRLRLVSVGLAGCQASSYPRKVGSSVLHRTGSSVQQQPTSSVDRQDLQEEESHVLVLNPGESSRVSYATHRNVPEIVGQTYGSVTSESASPVAAGYAAEMQQPGAEYAGPVDALAMADHMPSSSLQPEASSHPVATGTRHRAPSASSLASASSALQTRTDLPGVSALNVKCEKNHMTVSIYDPLH